MNERDHPAALQERDPRPGPPIVELRGVHLDFEGKPILRRLDLRVERKQRMVIMGQSGAGKSTLLRLILGILQPSSGKVLFNGLDLNKDSRRQINAARSEIDRIVEEKLAMVGMEETGPLMPSELSGGMRKRVAIARALVMEPELLLFDEPTTGLDPVLSSVIDDLIINLTEKAHATSIIVTHELASAFHIATRIAMLFQGRIIEEDRPERFRTSHNPVVEQFIEGRTEGPIH